MRLLQALRRWPAIRYEIDRIGAVPDDGAPFPDMLHAGHPRRGQLFETTTVPEIRVEAQAPAIHLVICRSATEA
jgi:hypothetical protein